MNQRNRRRSRRTSPPRRRDARRGNPRGRLLWSLFVLALLAGGLYVLYLDIEVRREFEGKRWELPARVYARPMELFAGHTLAQAELLAELQALGYRSSKTPDRPGTFATRGAGVIVVTREFPFWDGTEPGRRLRVRFAAGRIEALEEEGQAIALARLEPRYIGSLYPRHSEDRILVRRQEVPRALVDALIAVEDRGFYEHAGIDPVAVARALWVNLKAGAIVQGGSTLTQQLVKNFLLTPERSLTRKLKEALMALLLEWHYGKDEILEAYLNEVYLGQDGQRAIHGFGLASRFYYTRPLAELRLSEVAQLVALVKGPSLYDPRRSPSRALGRRNLILDLMARQGLIDPAQAKAAQEDPLSVTADPPSGLSPHPGFIDLVRRQLRRDYREEDLAGAGLRIFTTLDPAAQSAAEEVVGQMLPQMERARGLPSGSLQAAVVVTDPQSGEVQAVVSGRDVRYAGFNRALDARRPVGSLIKPVVYLSALSQGTRFSLATPVDDSPISVQMADGRVWSPDNYDHEHHGSVPLYQALANSYNLAAVRLGLELGLESVGESLSRLGLDREIALYPSSLLGAIDLSPLEVTRTYQTLASGGFHTPLRAIREVTAADGEPLGRYHLDVIQAADPRAVFILNRGLQLVVSEGTASGMDRKVVERLRPAGKTGTTDDLRDSWFAGFTGDRLATVWIGRDDNQPTALTGAAGAMRLWERIIQQVAAVPFTPRPPEGVEIARIDPATGEGFPADCPAGIELPFIAGSAPRSRSCGSPAYWP